MNFTYIRNKVKMVLTEQKMVILPFVVLIFVSIFKGLRIYKMFFFILFTIFTIYLGTFVLFFCCLVSKSRCS